MKQSRILLEALLLFLVFFMPGYIAQDAQAPGGVTTRAMLQVIVTGIPQLLLMVYVAEVASGPPGAWGLIPFLRRDSLLVFLLVLGSFAVVAPFVVAVLAVPSPLSRSLAAGYRWSLQDASQIPVALLFGLTAGYREEFFFRSYLFGRLGQLGVPVPLAVLCTTALFTVGHVYEGPLGIAIAAALGTLYSVVYLRRPSLHVIAIAHGLYNGSVLCLGLLLPRALPAAAGIRIFIWN